MNSCSDCSQELSFRLRPTVPTQRNTISYMEYRISAIFIANLKRLMAATGMSVPEVAAKAKISARGLHYTLDAERIPKIETVESIANVFGFHASHLLMPDFDPEVFKSGKFDAILHAYREADEQGRRVMESMGEYVVNSRKNSVNENSSPPYGKKNLDIS